MLENLRNEWIGLTRRIPAGSQVLRDEDNRYRGSLSPLDRFRR